MSTQTATEPSLVHLPFYPHDQRDRALLDGQITAIIHSQPVGHPGDILHINRLGLYCTIDNIHTLPLGVASLRYYRACGYTSRGNLLADYEQMHPAIGRQLTRAVFVYRFFTCPNPRWEAAHHAQSV